MFPDAPHWIWLIIAFVGFLVAFIVWPRDGQDNRNRATIDKDETVTSEGFLAHALKDIFPNEARELLGLFTFISIPILFFLLMFVILRTVIQYIE